MPRKSLTIDLSKLVFAITVWIFLSLNAKEFNFPIYSLLRWIFPVLLVVITAVCNSGKIPAPPALIYLFIIGVVPSFFNSVNITESIMMAISFVLVVYSMYVFFCGMRSTEKMEESIQIAIVLILLFQTLNILYCVLGLGMADSGRYDGFTTNPNTLGIYSNLALWGSFYFLRKSKGFVKWLSLFLFIASIVLALMSGSRTALALILINLVIIIFLSARSVYMRVFASIVAGTAVILLLSGNLTFLNITALDRLLSEGGTSRGEIWDEGLRIWRLNPIFGVGYRISALLNTSYGHEGMDFHNSYLSLLAEVGVWGVLFIGFPVLPIMVKAGIKTARNFDGTVFPIAFCMAITIAICAWAESFLFSVGSTEAFAFWMLFAWLIAYMKKERLKNE